MGYLKSIGTSIIYIGAFLAVITFTPGLPPYNVEFSEHDFVPPKDLTGKLATNDRLDGAEKLFEGQLLGPEDFASYNGELYTGVYGGHVLKITDKKIIPVVKFGADCDGLWQEPKCGRPLGLKFDSRGVLYVCDAYYGIFKVNVKTGKYDVVVDSKQPIEGKVPVLTNFLDIAKNGDIYWSDSTTEANLEDGVYTMLENPSGRLIKYNAATKKNEVLVHNLGFANGVALSENEDFVIVMESMTSRITKYNLKGPKAGKREIFIEGLPGFPDNVHKDGEGNFLVPIVVYADSENPSLIQSLIPHPYIRKMIVRFFNLLELPFKKLHEYYPNEIFEKCTHAIGSFGSMLFMMPKRVVVLQINENGQIVDALHSTDKRIFGISTAYIYNEYLYLGSPWEPYIARVPLKKALPNFKPKASATKNTAEKAQAAPATENPVPKTTKVPEKKASSSAEKKSSKKN